MHVYVNGAWVEGYLDEAERAGNVRVTVHRRVVLGPAEEQYFVRPARVAMLVTYLRALGPRRVLRKVRSRRSESVRNDAWLSIGCGTDPEGRPVLFIDPAGPRGIERRVLPEVLVTDADASALGARAGSFAPSASAGWWAGLATGPRDQLAALAGWRQEEGTPAEVSSQTWAAVAELVASPPSAYEALPAPPPPSAVQERVAATGEGSGPAFHLFGFGQYAKTQVIPNLGQRVRLAAVHELDPLQIGPVEEGDHAWDTSGEPRPDEAIRNAVLAGYHHTHAPLAVELLDRGTRHVVIEKPIASNDDQLEALLAALDRHPTARVHVAFQRRHSPFNALLRKDLGPGPISLAATVYEVPLPPRHWYRWPVVGNAVVSNGCHWIDHFLFLNDHAEVRRLGAEVLATQTVLTIDLANGASCSISLRHQGAPRRGVRDQCVFWNGDASVVIEDQRSYVAERGFRQVRRRRAHPYRSLESMYQTFGRRIEEDLPGDDVRSIRSSAATTLALARLVDEAPRP